MINSFKLNLVLLCAILIGSSVSAQVVVNANSVINFSSQYGSDGGDYSVEQVLGPQNTFGCSDVGTAWSPLEEDSGQEFFELGIPAVFGVTKVEIFENIAPGSIDTIALRKQSTGEWIIIYTGEAAPTECPSVKTVEIPATNYSVDAVRFTMKSDYVAFWSEIDAIQVTGASLLPLNYREFSAELLNSSEALLKWKTDSEVNTDFFSIEKSVDGKLFQKIAEVKSLNQSGVNTYTYRDADAISFNAKNVYYRLKQIDKDGKFTYSDIVSLKGQEQTDVSVYPNPTTDYLNVSLTAKQTGKYNITLTSTNGQRVYSERRNIEKGKSTFRINVSNKSTGIYLLNIANDKGEVVLRKTISKK